VVKFKSQDKRKKGTENTVAKTKISAILLTVHHPHIERRSQSIDMLKSFVIAVFAVVLCVQAGYAQSSQAWQKFTSKGEFEAMFPGKPVFEAEKLETGDPRTRQQSYSVDADAGYFAVSITGLQAEVDAADADSVLDAGLEALLFDGGKIISKSPITEGGFPGRRFKIQSAVNGIKIVFNGKMLLAGKTHYTVMVTTPEAGAGSPDIGKFLASFRVAK
jgi:hypothetical protein